MSLMVQAFCTDLSASSLEAAPGAGCCRGADSDRAGAGAAGSAGAAAGSAGFSAMALTAVLHDSERLDSLRMRHSSASLPPGVTPEQLAMKSERHDARMASRCACVGCCAANGLIVS